jgi:hypothetical protein
MSVAVPRDIVHRADEIEYQPTIIDGTRLAKSMSFEAKDLTAMSMTRTFGGLVRPGGSSSCFPGASRSVS